MATSYHASNWWDAFENDSTIYYILLHNYILSVYTSAILWAHRQETEDHCCALEHSALPVKKPECTQNVLPMLPTSESPTNSTFFKDRLALGSHTIGDLVMGRPIREAAQLSQTTLAKLKAVCFFGTCNALYM